MFKRLLLLVSTSLLLSACTFKFPSLPGAKKAGLQVTTSPQAAIFLDGNSLGLSPVLEEKLSSGDHTLKIVPSDSSLQPWETKITLASGVLTVIDRKISLLPDQSHGYTLSFEKVSAKDSQLAITTLPDSATIVVDGNPQGFTPLSLDNLSAGDHTIILSSTGFEDKLIRARTLEGYRLTVSAQLSKKPATATVLAETTSTPSAQISPSLTPAPTPTPTKKATPVCDPTASSSATIAKPYVEIQDTPTGFLRVRDQATTTAAELAQVCPGSKYPYLNDTQGGWHKLEYAAGKQGWVSGQYSAVVK